MRYLLSLFAYSLLFINFATASSVDMDIAIIKNSIKSKFLHKYPAMQIKTIEIHPQKEKPKSLKNFKLDKVYISKSSLRRSTGTLSALYIKDHKKRKLYFRYNIIGEIGVYKTSTTIKKDETISSDNLNFEYIPFRYLNSIPIDSSYINNYRAKYTIISGKVISKKDLKQLVDVNRDDTLTATIFDSDVMVNFTVTALEEGNIGDSIYVKRDHGKKLRAKIVSKSSVEILP